MKHVLREARLFVLLTNHSGRTATVDNLPQIPLKRHGFRLARFGILRAKVNHIFANIGPAQRLDTSLPPAGDKTESAEVAKIFRQVWYHCFKIGTLEKSLTLIADFGQPRDERSG